MAKNKTTETSASVTDFIKRFASSDEQQEDSFVLLQLIQKITGHEPKMWGPTIIGFGNYHYKYKSGHEGDAPLVGFSPRKAAISLYVFTGAPEHEYLLDKLGKFKRGKACLYIKKLSDIDQQKLTTLIKETIGYLKKLYK